MKKILMILLVCVLVSGVPYFASGQSQHGTPAQVERARATGHEESPWRPVFQWANFLVLFGGLAYLLRKPASEFFESRRTNILCGLQRAQEAQVTVQARMDEIEQRLRRLSTDVASLRSQAEKESLVEREKIVAEAKREVDRIVEQSRHEIDRVARSIQREIKETVADMVVDRAQNTLRSEMTQDDQKRVVVRFIKKL